MKNIGWLAACLIAAMMVLGVACGDIENDTRGAEEGEHGRHHGC